MLANLVAALRKGIVTTMEEFMKAFLILTLFLGAISAQAENSAMTVEQCRSEIIKTHNLDETLVAEAAVSSGDARETGWKSIEVQAQPATDDYEDFILMCVQKNVVTACVLNGQDLNNTSKGSCEL